ncbi:L-2-hydroxyglutarate oxidase [Pseudooceanicola sediminis]|uniref:L-2-hydroxyglutarate oxidase n=1 Tax=Pseudooceanicola sediminis TaxID=2211117 RepID=A0A399J544_9RHOB|nr:L-2-hydroxyglutarate oxidase [Pseudooceanicola sediminis]KAA2315518.1 L-2-hydroxyglutarate oxidase [Puniceibacterium sp. HSS470]RII40441.1 L-2-hydroxyglutarate oxidase [Pseudooceanicola sediminis]|tara:strand:+ start:78825 stop:80015 length:1191 start_codon:yes stop_codon:yes gene_type:complete
MIHDYCIIGGGIVGLATARALLARTPGASLILLEKETALGQHQTGHNSGVIHSGIYYAPGSFKARLCREGAARTKEFCQQHAIAYEDRGKMIVATRPDEVPRLDALYDRAGENGIRAELISGEEITAREPNVTGLKGIFVPEAAIVNYTDLLHAMAAEIIAQGAEIRYATQPRAIVEGGNSVTVTTDSGVIEARRLIACAGLQSDRVAKMAGLDLDLRIVPFRGEYYRLAPRRNDVVRAMIYPVPEPGLPFLGTHLTPMIDGSVTVGPNAMLGFAREGYPKFSVNLRDSLDMVSFPGFWSSIRQFIKPGLNELGNSLFKSRYLRECQRYCPDLELSDLTPMTCGIRAQAVMKDGTMQSDFVFRNTDRMLHVCNAPSPAATSALPIGDMIADRVLAA